jgi:hypothetical protein
LDTESNVIDVCISTLRSKIDKPFENPLIHTVIGPATCSALKGRQPNGYTLWPTHTKQTAA